MMMMIHRLTKVLPLWGMVLVGFIAVTHLVQVPLMFPIVGLIPPRDTTSNRRRTYLTSEDSTKSEPVQPPPPPLVPTAAAAAAAPKSKLLAEPLEYMKYGIPLRDVYNNSTTTTAPNNNGSAECSCTNPYASADCCRRMMQRPHKFGYVLTMELLGEYIANENENYYVSNGHNQNQQQIEMMEAIPMLLQKLIRQYIQSSPNDNSRQHQDWRLVQVMRNLISALISGYLYHKDGRECWKDPLGRLKPHYRGQQQLQQQPQYPRPRGKQEVAVPKRLRRRLSKWAENDDWGQSLSYELDPPANGRSLCQYLADTDEATGIRAYIDYIMCSKYKSITGIWAMAQEINYFRDRTMTVCFEDLAISNNTQFVYSKVNGLLDFLYNGTKNHKPWIPPSYNPRLVKAVKDQHSTSHDPTLRQKLVNTIMEIDQQYYNGDIAFLNSVLPC